jgi:putative endonuclease
VTGEPRICNDFAQRHAHANVTRLALRTFVANDVSHVTSGAVASPFVSTDLRHHLGRLGEDLALAHLERLGYAPVARNHRTRYGEIDLVVFDGTTLVFVEVKTRRTSGARRGPWEALDERKCRQVRRMAAAFLLEVTDRPHSPALRFDAIGVLVDGQGRLARLDHLEAAF